MQTLSLGGIAAIRVGSADSRLHPHLRYPFTTQHIIFELEGGGEFELTLHLKEGLPTLAAGPLVSHAGVTADAE